MGWEQRNADFCKAQTDAQMAYIEAEREVDQLQAENAELRQLVRVMAYCMQEVRDCDGCAANGADGAATAPSGCDWLRERMREMGVVE